MSKTAETTRLTFSPCLALLLYYAGTAWALSFAVLVVLLCAAYSVLYELRRPPVFGAEQDRTQWQHS